MAKDDGVLVCEVGPRDGLQNEARTLTPRRRVELVDRLSSCGFERIEAVSFVSASRVPQMAFAEEVMRGITRRAGTTYSGLALNLRGARRALDCGVDRINFAFAATETFNRRNQGRPIAESLRELADVAERARDANVPCTATLGAALGCPFEGVVSVDTVAGLAGQAARAGADEIVLADTIGVGVPSQVAALVRAARDAAGDVRLGCHLHDTRNTGIANAVAALAEGVETLDASVGGAGGCPFAPGATGNIPTEDLLYVLHGMGYQTGVGVAEVIAAAEWLEREIGHPLPGMVKRAGLDWHLASP